MAAGKTHGAVSFSYDISGGKGPLFGRIPERELDVVVRSSASGLVSVVNTNAPMRTGDLRRGIIPSPMAERSATPGKIVYDVYMDEKMNSTFVKHSKSGKRYYYPASMEYGFIQRDGMRYPGQYYMRDTSVSYYATHEAAVLQRVERVIKEMEP